MVNKNIVSNRIEEIKAHLLRIKPYSQLSVDAFLKDQNAQDVVEYNSFQIINHLINLMEHIVIDEHYGLPQTAYESASFLCEKGVWDEKDLQVCKKMIGFRNVLGHDYIHLDKQIVYQMLRQGKDDIERLIGKIALKFL